MSSVIESPRMTACQPTKNKFFTPFKLLKNSDGLSGILGDSLLHLEDFLGSPFSYLRLEVVIQCPDDLFSFFSIFSLCVSLWMVYTALSPSSLAFSFSLYNLLSIQCSVFSSQNCSLKES